MLSELPHAPATERNRDPILQVLRLHLAGASRLLEIGSGTGQHAVHCAAALPHLQWQCSDRDPQLPGIRAWLAHAGLANTPAPLALDVDGDWPQADYDAAFSANTLHILAWPQVERMFAGLAQVLVPAATLVIYGPFRYQGRHTSASNAEFDRALKQDHPQRGIRDVEQVHALAQAIGLHPVADLALPANNHCLVWRRKG